MDGAASAPLRCAGLRSAPAAREFMRGGKEVQQGIGKLVGEWHFTLEGKISVGTNDLSPQGGN